MCVYVWVGVGVGVGEASLQNPQNVAQNEMVVSLDYKLINLNKLQ